MSKQRPILFSTPQWRDIDGYEDRYLIGDCGQVLSLARSGCGKNNKLMSIQINNCGYKTVLLSHDGKRKRHLLHRLIAFAFVPNPQNKGFINHKDGDKLNNCIDNLEWVTRSENVCHAMKSGLKNDYGKGKPLTPEHRKNLSKSLQGRKSPCGNRGKKRSPEAIEKFRTTMKIKRNERS